MSGWRQAGLCILAVLVALLDLVPVELQRRIIDDAVTEGNLALLWRLGLLYGGVVVVHQILKWLLRMAQARTAESAAMYTRAHALGVRVKGAGARSGVGHERPTKGRGESAVVLGNDVDKLAGFVGEGPSNAASAAAMLLGVFGYMLWTEPRIAVVAGALLAPQALAAPFFQRRINTLTAKRVRLLRDLGERSGDDRAALRNVRRLLPPVYVNRIALTAVKSGMKAVLNLLNQAGPLAALIYGGWLVAQGETTVGVIVAFVSAFQRASDPLRELLSFYRKAQAARVQHDLVAEWMTETGGAERGEDADRAAGTGDAVEGDAEGGDAGEGDAEEGDAGEDDGEDGDGEKGDGGAERPDEAEALARAEAEVRDAATEGRATPAVLDLARLKDEDEGGDGDGDAGDDRRRDG